ncbi:terpenoid synthase [Aspergillus sclerotiicarbonarius CBS 121057]|uniref:Terpene synthase n=1 Tax=Aspergillus sclerotiicarbonarius (strain CBS 121057 / IBT 28362) TaxID=1448318 RepID=A0A319EGD9_ASPSB|nr:terpenoid synthase [Aspergillus sclerotiicarbonarius CBS 121057]
MASAARVDVIKQLQRETITIQGLRSAFARWPFGVNKHLDQVRADVECTLRTRFKDHPKLQKLVQGDYGLFGATSWPCANYMELLIATYLSLWLFMWDDALDSDVGELAHDFDAGQLYRAETLGFVKTHLGLDDPQVVSTSSNGVIQSFDQIGAALRSSCSVDQRRTFLKEFRLFMDKSEIEQSLRLRTGLVNLDEYSRYRRGTSAVRVVLAINQYCHGIDLPPDVTKDPDYTTLWHLTNVNIYSVNDLLSVKKELAQGSAGSLVPILYAELGSAQKAADQVMRIVTLTIAEFDQAAERLVTRHGGKSAELARELETFIVGCRYYCTGNLTWSLSTGRYGVHQELEDDRLTIALGGA